MSKKRNKDLDIVISSLGTSTTEVTGSCWSISYPKDNGERGLIVIECGLNQGANTIKQQYNNNKRMIENIGKDIIDNAEYVLLTHSHVDHVGNLSIFNSNTNNFNGRILASKKCIEISKELIKDSVFIHTKNVESLKNNGEKVKPLYTEKDMYDMFSHMDYIEVGKEIKLNNNLTVIFNNNSHVVGSCNIKLIFRKPNNSIKTIIYSGDIGSALNKDLTPYLENQFIPSKCNLFISEATYNDKERQITKQDVINERNELKQYIKDSLCNGRRILFPTFAFGRSQTIATMIYDWFKDEEWFENIPVVMDGYLMNNINSVYRRILNNEDKEKFENVLNWKNLIQNKSYDGTIALLSERKVAIYIVSSGFMENGRITTYLPQFLGCSNDVIISTGYCGGEGSIGWKILNKNQKTITIDKHTVLKRADIKQYKSFSSHITHDELLQLWSNIKCDKILVHHSGKNKGEFISEAKEYLRNKNVTTNIVEVNKGSNQFVL